MESEKDHHSTDAVKFSAKSCSFEGDSNTAEQKNKTASMEKGSGKRAMRCIDCQKKFDGWRMLQRHRRKSCPKSSLRFFCRECKAFFPSKVDLKSHISAAHTDNDKHSKKLRKQKSAKAANRDRKMKKRTKVGRNMEFDKEVMETCTIGGNPFFFTTSCAPDAQSFQFLCQSCLTVRFATYIELRQHEDWCARVKNQGVICLPCGRHYRSCGTLRRHADEYHKKLVPLEIKKVVENPYCFSTTIAPDAAKFPYVCSSCQVVCFSSLTNLRRHEDWCGQCVYGKDGWKCEKCTRYFRTAALLELHMVAEDCLKTDTAAQVASDGECTGGTESELLHDDVKQEAVSATTSHGVCPLCDIPFISQYERQVHFTHIHNLTSSELKIKQPAQRHCIVTCLDCDLTFSSRLELFQHKRICTKEKIFTKIIVPVTRPARAAGNNQSDSRNSYCNKVDSSLEKEGSPKAARIATASDTSGNAAAKFDDQSEGKVTELLSRTQLSRGQLLNTTKVRSLDKRTSAKQLLLKPDGELLLLGDGSQKISTVSGKPVATEISGEYGKTDSGCVGNGSAPNLLEKPKQSLPRDLASEESAQKSAAFVHSHEADKYNVHEGVSLASDSERTESLDSDTEVDLKPCSPEFNQTVQEQCQIPPQSDKVTCCDSSGSKSVSASVLKSFHGINEQRKLTRKRSLQNVMSTADIVDFKNSALTEMGHEVKSHAVASSAKKQEKPVLKDIRTKTLADVKHCFVQKSADQPMPCSESEAKATESSSEADNGQQSLLAALQLVPVSAQLKETLTVSARYQTRSSVHARLGEDEAVKKSGNDTKDMTPSASQKRVESSPKTFIDRNKTVGDAKRKITDVTGKSVPWKTRTVEPVGTSFVRCVACKTIFQTVRQIVVHNCVNNDQNL